MEDAVHFLSKELLFKQSLDLQRRCVWFCYKLALNLILRFPDNYQQSFLFIFWGVGGGLDSSLWLEICYIEV